MNDLQSARACRTYASVFPELSDSLNRLEAGFLRHVVSDQLNQSRSKPLDQRRAKVAAWPDLLADLSNAANRRAGGLPIDIDDLKSRAAAIASEMDAYDALATEEDQIPQLRKVAGMTTPVQTDGAFPDWVRHFGRRNPNLHSRKALARIESQLAKHARLKQHRLEDILFAKFVEQNVGRFGSMGMFLDEAAFYPTSKWYWEFNEHLQNALVQTITKAINAITRPALEIVNVLWKHSYAWRYTSAAEPAARAAVEAIMAVYDAVRISPADHITSPDDLPEIHALHLAIERLKSAHAALIEMLTRLYPQERFEEKASDYRLDTLMSDVRGTIQFSKIDLIVRPSLWQRIRAFKDFWFSRPFHECYDLRHTQPWHSKPSALTDSHS
jgi:hypothetical protein